MRLFDGLERLAVRQYIAPNISSNTTDIQTGQAKLVPMYNIYASSMMASRSPIVAAQLPVATWRIGRDDATQWDVAAGDYLAIEIDNQQITLPVQVVPYLAEGCIGYPVGQISIIHPSMPASVRKVDAPISLSNAMLTDSNASVAPTMTQEV